MGGLFIFNTHSSEKASFQNVFLYKINDSVYSMNDIKLIKQQLTSLSCIYEESLLSKVYSDVIQIPNKSPVFEFKDYSIVKYTKRQMEVFKKFISYSKLFSYAESHKVEVQDSVVKAFYLASRQSNCKVSIFESSKKFKKSFHDVMKVEIFLRSRFLPSNTSDKGTSSKDIDLSIKSTKSLLRTIDKQILEEVYW